MKNIFLFVLLSVFGMSCGFPKSKPIKFNRDKAEVKRDLQKHGDFEAVEFSSNTYFKGKSTATTNSLAVILKGGKNLPDETNGPNEKMKILAELKARIIADALQNKNDFDSIEIHFIIETKSGLVTTTTDRNFTFTIKELELEWYRPNDSLFPAK
jgi:hypothetical protein